MDKTLHLLIMYTMLVLMLFLLQKGRNDKRSLYLAVYAIIEVLTNGIDSISLWGGNFILERFPTLLFILKPITLLWVPFFYFYVRSCFSNLFKLEKKHFLHLLPFGVIMLFFLIVYLFKKGQNSDAHLFSYGSAESYSIFIIDYIVRLQYIIYNVYLINQLLKLEKKRKLNESTSELNVNIKWLRFIVYGYASACLGAVLTYISMYINWDLAIKLNLVSILYFFLFFFIIFYDTIAPKSFSSILKKKQATPPDSELHDIMNQLKSLFNKNPLYLEADLSLNKLSEVLKIKERRISQAINTIENRIFKDYINELRIKHAIELLSSQKDKPIFEVMFESGFNTKAPFNSAFKKFTGQTPSEFRNALEEQNRIN